MEYLECGKHLALFLAIDEAIVVLHRDERRELVLYRIVCEAWLEQLKGLFSGKFTLHGVDCGRRGIR